MKTLTLLCLVLSSYLVSHAAAETLAKCTETQKETATYVDISDLYRELERSPTTVVKKVGASIVFTNVKSNGKALSIWQKLGFGYSDAVYKVNGERMLYPFEERRILKLLVLEKVVDIELERESKRHTIRLVRQGTLTSEKPILLCSPPNLPKPAVHPSEIKPQRVSPKNLPKSAERS